MSLKRQTAEIVREYQPIDEGRIHGVTFDGKLVWFARDGELVAFDPETEKVVHRHAVESANAGTAFDGEHLYQIAHEQILVVRPSDGRVLRTLPAPGKGADSGMAWADGHLYVGQFEDRKIHKIDAKTGAIVKTFSCDRYVTGVSCVEGALWHGSAFDGKPGELRRLGEDGSVEESLEVPTDWVSGVEGTKSGDFWVGGDKGRLRLVRRKRAG
jgi:outer membrane protein assembly factor BamB